jgi:hypothetical protein
MRDRPLAKSDQIKVVTLAFMFFVTAAQLTGGKIGWVPPRYEAYVLVLNLCGLAIIYHEKVSTWCKNATWPRVSAFCAVLLMVFAGYATQFLLIPTQARNEYQGPYQLHRFVTEFYRAPVAVDQVGYVNFGNPSYVLDLSGIASEAARNARALDHSSGWMDALLGRNNIALAIIDSANDSTVPGAWVEVATLTPQGQFAGAVSHRYIFFARRASDVATVESALDRFAATLPPQVRLTRGSASPSAGGA